MRAESDSQSPHVVRLPDPVDLTGKAEALRSIAVKWDIEERSRRLSATAGTTAGITPNSKPKSRRRSLRNSLSSLGRRVCNASLTQPSSCPELTLVLGITPSRAT